MSALRISAPVVIFVRPQAAGNIGALARVMSNFGAAELRLVGPQPGDFLNPDEASKMDWALACKGASVLESARRYASLRDALEGVHVAIGTSGKKDNFFELGYARPFVSATEAFAEVEREAAAQGPHPLRWALVLGPESDGLSAEEASLCRQLAHVDTVDENPSINVAMAAGLFLYHWMLFARGAFDAASPVPAPLVAGTGAFPLAADERPATLDEKESFLEYLIDTLKHTQFFKTPDTAQPQARLRRWLQSQPAALNDLRTAFEALYQLRSWGLGRYEARNFFGKKG